MAEWAKNLKCFVITVANIPKKRPIKIETLHSLKNSPRTVNGHAIVANFVYYSVL